MVSSIFSNFNNFLTDLIDMEGLFDFMVCQHLQSHLMSMSVFFQTIYSFNKSFE